MPSILFVCTHNLFRSPIAAAFFSQVMDEKGLAEKMVVNSAGTWATPDTLMPPLAIEAASKYKADLRKHQAVLINRSMLLEHDLILGMERGQKEAIQYEFPEVQNRVFLLSEVVDNRIYDIPDPAFFDETAAVNLVDDLYDLIQRGYKNIFLLSNKLSKT